MTLNPGSVKTISEALRAASVESATAIPISAFFRAGASFTPSPVIPHICFRACNLLTISYLCSAHEKHVNGEHHLVSFSKSKVHGYGWSLCFTEILDVVPSFPKVHRWSQWFALCNVFSPYVFPKVH
ncbi:hypothetical protein Hanom_Chr04g00289301 [Helianthus anomalus]